MSVYGEDPSFDAFEGPSDDAVVLVGQTQQAHIDEADRQRRAFNTEMQRLRDADAALLHAGAAEKFLCVACRHIFNGVAMGRKSPACERCRSTQTTPTMLRFTTSAVATRSDAADSDVVQKQGISEAPTHAATRQRSAIEAPTITEE